MPVSSYFNQYTHTGQQNLLESLIIESIQIYGLNMYFLPRISASMDEIFRESDVNIFETAYLIESYVKSVDGFQGDGKFMSVQLGLEIRDQVVFTIAQKTFKDITSLVRPKEGDLLYFPLDQKCYEIKFVDHQDIFYQLGKLNTWDLTCELLEYNGQIFRTGIDEIDSIDTTYTIDGSESTLYDDWIDQSTEIQDETPGVVDFSENDPFSLGNNL